MTSRLNPYIAFSGNAREAIEFYQSIFGGDLTLHTFGQFGAPDPSIADQVMHAQLETPQGYTLMVSDTPPGMSHTPGDNVTVSLSGTDGDELRKAWAGLSAGGTINMPLEKQMWGDEFGQLVDRFGIPWMVNIVGAG
ncbi:PhnB protein [Actinoplanes campanulatus]|uniref:PhnB protein n=1 Tax=Actinoplanes campanulatus TaxID=113559 RepID=A0A7W5AIA3_9ACTN|nr:VOC family protein [Actinoplanes campanulatus]MBB3096797.1 PhnB protein [Actinoplanes campanulatus]GGN31402.1 VOC family protein [Actinoplanes campanulatus]GID37343.1 VOC family protein [Actinoplanes campanulatus]